MGVKTPAVEEAVGGVHRPHHEGGSVPDTSLGGREHRARVLHRVCRPFPSARLCSQPTDGNRKMLWLTSAVDAEVAAAAHARRPARIAGGVLSVESLRQEDLRVGFARQRRLVQRLCPAKCAVAAASLRGLEGLDACAAMHTDPPVRRSGGKSSSRRLATSELSETQW